MSFIRGSKCHFCDKSINLTDCSKQKDPKTRKTLEDFGQDSNIFLGGNANRHLLTYKCECSKDTTHYIAFGYALNSYRVLGSFIDDYEEAVVEKENKTKAEKLQEEVKRLKKEKERLEAENKVTIEKKEKICYDKNRKEKENEIDNMTEDEKAEIIKKFDDLDKTDFQALRTFRKDFLGNGSMDKASIILKDIENFIKSIKK